MQRGTLQQILTSLSIPWKDEGKAININCPFDHSRGGKSGLPDTEFRCGIFFDRLIYHCFRCKRKGDLYQIFQTLLNMQIDEYRLLVKSHVVESGDTPSDAIRERLNPAKAEDEKTEKVELPRSHPVDKELVGRHPLLRGFLEARRIAVETCVEYEVRYTGNVGKYAHKLIIPIYDGPKLVAWQGRDISGRAKSKYFSQGSLMQCLYWTAEVRFDAPTRIFLVEGIFDAWRLGYNAVACFSHALTRRQRYLLLTDHVVDEVVIAFDSDSCQLAKVLAREVRPIIDKVGYVKLPDGEDPDSFGGDETRRLPITWA